VRTNPSMKAQYRGNAFDGRTQTAMGTLSVCRQSVQPSYISSWRQADRGADADQFCAAAVLPLGIEGVRIVTLGGICHIMRLTTFLAGEYAMLLLKPGGIFVSFTPMVVRALGKPPRTGVSFGVRSTRILLMIISYITAFKRSPRVIGSSPVTNASMPDEVTMMRLDQLAREKLFFAARKSGDIWA
jgi:hypothetical protein